MGTIQVRHLVALLIALLTAGLVVTWMVGSRLVASVNHPVPLPSGLPVEVVSIPGPGHAIAGWWLDQGLDSPVILLLHAVRADRSSMVSRAILLSKHGFSVLLIDLQGHGETPGATTTFGLLESADVQAAHAWLAGVAPSRKLGVIGCSLGGAAVLLGPQPSGFDAIVLEAVYPRISSAIENRVRIRLGPLAPVVAPLLLAQLPLRLHIAPRDLAPIRSIDRVEAPVLLVAGSLDEHTTLADSQEMFRAAKPPKRLWIVSGAGHEDFLAFDPEGYTSQVVEFLAKHLRLSNRERG